MLKASCAETHLVFYHRDPALCCRKAWATRPGEHFYVCSDVGYAGGGSMPGKELPTVVVQWCPARRLVEATMAALREAEVPVIARIRDDAICFDLRTLRPSDFELLLASVSAAGWDEGAGSARDGVPLPVLQYSERSGEEKRWLPPSLNHLCGRAGGHARTSHL